jgi:DNA-directed RNA polymerase subunit M/transcription elongation factor TFIIS
MVTIDRRLPVVIELARIVESKRYAIQAEQALLLAAEGDHYIYSEMAYAMIARLRANARWIVSNVPASEVHQRPWRELCTGMQVISDEEADKQRATDFRALLAQNVDSVRAVTKGEAVVCRKCGSSEVAIVLRQTRSADEGMSGFASCRRCGKRWKLN